MLLAVGLLAACASGPSSDAAYTQSRTQGCALNRYSGCPDAPYAPQEPWPYIYYPVAAIPVYPIAPGYPVPPVDPPPRPKPHKRPVVGGHCEKPSPKKPAHGCP